MNSKTLYLIIVILLGCLLLQFGCEKETPEVKTDYSHLYKKIEKDSMTMVSFMEKAYQDSLSKIDSKRKTDSISKVANKYISLYKKASGNVYVQLSQGICDTISVRKLVNACDSTFIAMSNESAQKDTTIKKVESENLNLRSALQSSNDINDAARDILKGQADDNQALHKELKKVKRNNKIKTTLLIIGDVLKDALLIFALKK
jgi:hypothetical protein